VSARRPVHRIHTRTPNGAPSQQCNATALGDLMHAYHHYAIKATLTSCPSCHKRAEIIDCFTLPSTDGPVVHLKVRCEDGHAYTVVVDDKAAVN
jgi:hypothetical protein